MKRRKIRYVVGTLLSTLLVLTGEPAASVLAASPQQEQLCCEAEEIMTDQAVADCGSLQEETAQVGEETSQEQAAVPYDDPVQSETVAGDSVYPASSSGSYSIRAQYSGGSRSGQYDKYTVSITGIDTTVNINTKRSVKVQSDYSGNAGSSLITSISYANAATAIKPALYQNEGKSNYNYLHNALTLHVPTGYRITNVSYSGQGTRGTFYHLYLKNDSMQFHTDQKTWNAQSAEELTIAHASTGKATDIAIRSMVDIFYNAGVGTTSEKYKDAHGSVRQEITVSPITYTLAYQANGGSGGPGTQTMTYDTAATLPAAVPVRTGYLFGGWSIGKVTYNAGQTLTAAQVCSFSATQGETVTATAVWKPITYSVAYDLKGGLGIASGQSVAYDAQFRLPAAPTREGYSFGGWMDGNGKCYEAEKVVQASAFCATDGGTVTFTAKWITGAYQVAFYRSQQEEQPQQTVTYCIDETVSLPDAPDRKGYLFTGWQIDGATYTAGQSVRNLTMTNGARLSAYALWQPIRYSISYDGNGATEGTTSNQDNLAYDVSYRLQSNGFKKQFLVQYDLQGGQLENPLKTVSARFAGWKGMQTELLENNAVITNLTDVSETVTLYAVWDDSPLTVALPSPVKKETTRPESRDNKAGYLVTSYTFAGWQCADGTLIAEGQKITVDKDLELTAQWTETTKFAEKLTEEDETKQIINKLDEIGNKLSNGYDLTQEQAQQILDAIEDGSSFQLQIGQVKYTIVRNEDGTLSIQLAAMADGTEKITIPSEVKIGAHTYAITEIYKECFRNNTALKEVTIGNHITKIGDAAFAGCSALKKVTIAEGLVTIGEKAFDGCRQLTQISLPKSLQTIGDAAFRDCRSLKKVTLRNGLLTIGNYAFYRCKSLLKIRIPDTVMMMGKYAFARCSSLGTVTCAKGCTKMGEGVFSDCSALKKITLKAGLTEIPAKAFYNCKKMTSVKMGSKVTQIGRQAFGNCRKLKSVTIPGRVMTIREKAFYQCSSLKKIQISSTHLSSVGKNAFKKCAKGLQFAVPVRKREAYVKLLRGKY